MNKSVGILGIGTYLPTSVRTNDWWSADVVANWGQRRAAPLTDRVRIEPTTAGGRAIAEAMASLRDDPFHGAIERRIIDPGVRASDMEKAAAEEAIAHAGIDRRDIGLLLCNTFTPDFLVTNNACLLHHNLELSPSCFSMATEAGCNAFMMQIALARDFIANGRAKYALLVQCANISPLLPMNEAHSAWFGDGCSAQILGPVDEGFGVLGDAHRTAGHYHRTMVGSARDGLWYEGGKVEMYSADHGAARKSFLEIADSAADVTGEALANAGLTTSDVDFYAPHQPTRWFREVTQKHLRLVKARHVDTFQTLGSMAAANIPIGIAMGVREGLLRRGDVVLSFAGGAGLTFSGLVMRWAR